jgi:hypothetical protein
MPDEESDTATVEYVLNVLTQVVVVNSCCLRTFNCSAFLRSSQPTRLEYFTVIILLYPASISDLEVIQQRVENACQEIRVKPGIFDRVRTSVRRSAGRCVEMEGNHI